MLLAKTVTHVTQNDLNLTSAAVKGMKQNEKEMKMTVSFTGVHRSLLVMVDYL